jgi:hypothetical protein
VSNYGDEADAKTIREWLAWLDGAEVADKEKAIVTFLADRAKRREAQFPTIRG